MKLVFEDNDLCRSLYGPHEAHLRKVEELLGVSLHARGNELRVAGPEDRSEAATDLLRQLYGVLEKGFPVFESDVTAGARALSSNRQLDLAGMLTDTVFVTHRNRHITPKGANQKAYLDAMRRHDIVFGIGPAGTGKTYLAMAMAVAALTRREVRRIVLARPAVEAGERLGFLPGTLTEKVNPYLRPLYDALHDMLEPTKVEEHLQSGAVEIAPLAFMRGRTLNDSFVVLDEAQNTTPEQMKMFLTRLGYDSKAVITGDITQIDLPDGVRSGLLASRDVLREVEGISFCRFTEVDVVRHPLVQRIVRAYEEAEERARRREG